MKLLFRNIYMFIMADDKIVFVNSGYTWSKYYTIIASLKSKFFGGQLELDL